MFNKLTIILFLEIAATFAVSECPDGFTSINEGNTESCIKLITDEPLSTQEAEDKCAESHPEALLPIFNSLIEYQGFKSLVSMSGMESQSIRINGDIRSDNTIFDRSGSVNMEYPKASKYSYDETKNCLSVKNAAIVASNCEEASIFACQILRCPLGWISINHGNEPSCVTLIKDDKKTTQDAEDECGELYHGAHLPLFSNDLQYLGFRNYISSTGMESENVHVNGDIRSDGTIYDIAGSSLLQYPEGTDFVYDGSDNCLCLKNAVLVKNNCNTLAIYACQLTEVNF